MIKLSKELCGNITLHYWHCPSFSLQYMSCNMKENNDGLDSSMNYIVISTNRNHWFHVIMLTMTVNIIAILRQGLPVMVFSIGFRPITGDHLPRVQSGVPTRPCSQNESLHLYSRWPHLSKRGSGPRDVHHSWWSARGH